jgi:hypothetical protein
MDESIFYSNKIQPIAKNTLLSSEFNINNRVSKGMKLILSLR